MTGFPIILAACRSRVANLFDCVAVKVVFIVELYVKIGRIIILYMSSAVSVVRFLRTVVKSLKRPQAFLYARLKLGDNERCLSTKQH